jgi:hypothetical protein
MNGKSERREFRSYDPKNGRGRGELRDAVSEGVSAVS